MGLNTEEATDATLNIFWREVVLPDELTATQRPVPLEEIAKRVNENVTLSIDSKLELIEMVELLARSVAAKIGFDEDASASIELATREAVVNGILHGNQCSADKRVEVQFLVEPEAMAIYHHLVWDPIEPKR